MNVFLIVCPLVFLAGFVDAIGGGGGLISLPAYLLAGLPAHQAIATNKLSSACGTALTTARFARQKLIVWSMALPAVVAALAGSWIGAHLSLLMDPEILTRILYFVLPVTAVLVLKKGVLRDKDSGSAITTDTVSAGMSQKKITVIVTVVSFAIGMYDGFYGPGTGTFLILAFSLFTRMDVHSANGLTKAVNLTTNVTSLLVYLHSGQVVIMLGLAAAACNMAGNWLGSGMAIRSGTRITRPVILGVLALLFIKIWI